jgi:hypothetical protein
MVRQPSWSETRTVNGEPEYADGDAEVEADADASC